MTATAIEAGAPAPAVNRAMIMVSIMLATTMTSLDTTIANVALPHMAGSVSASADQITWVLTSYIIASAIMTPMSGWLAERLGRKQVYIIAIIGFTIASALCGAAQNLGEIVVFRVLQGVFGAPMAPLTQAVIVDTFPLKQRGQAISIWTMGVSIAPIAGPVLGGWITDDVSWRWVFYINLPIGVAALAGVMAFLHDDKPAQKIRFDAIGFSLLSLAVAALQICLDRGQGRGWFDSSEIVVETAVGGVAFLLFLIHSATAEKPFVPLALFRDRNFVGASVIGFSMGTVFYSVLALLPSLTQNLMGYPVVASGMVIAPRGLGGMITMFLAGQIANRVDPRALILTGMLMLSLTFFLMSGFSLQMDDRFLLLTGFMQGAATGFIFVPMSILAFATLKPELRGDGAGAFTLIRSVGNSIGISIMEAILIRNTAAEHSRLAEPIHPDNPLIQASHGAVSLVTPQGVAGVVGEVGRQASMVAYVDVFRLMCIVTLAALPLVLVVRPPPRGQPPPTVTE